MFVLGSTARLIHYILYTSGKIKNKVISKLSSDFGLGILFLGISYSLVYFLTGNLNPLESYKILLSLTNDKVIIIKVIIVLFGIVGVIGTSSIFYRVYEIIKISKKENI